MLSARSRCSVRLPPPPPSAQHCPPAHSHHCTTPPTLQLVADVLQAAGLEREAGESVSRCDAVAGAGARAPLLASCGVADAGCRRSHAPPAGLSIIMLNISHALPVPRPFCAGCSRRWLRAALRRGRPMSWRGFSPSSPSTRWLLSLINELRLSPGKARRFEGCTLLCSWWLALCWLPLSQRALPLHHPSERPSPRAAHLQAQQAPMDMQQQQQPQQQQLEQHWHQQPPGQPQQQEQTSGGGPAAMETEAASGSGPGPPGGAHSDHLAGLVAAAEGASCACPHCGGVVAAARYEVHIAAWCPALHGS